MYCSKCGNGIAEGGKFCTFCGAPVATAEEQQIYRPGSAQPGTTWQPQQTQTKKGIPVWGWLLIGCGVLFLALPILGIFGAIAVPTMISTRNAAMESFANGVLATVRSAEAAYYAKNETYGDLKVLADDGYLDSRFYGNEIVDFDGREGLNLSFTTDGSTYKCTIDVPAVGTLTLDESGGIEGP